MHVPGRQFVEGSNNEKSVRTRKQSPKAPATDIESLGPINLSLTDQKRRERGGYPRAK